MPQFCTITGSAFYADGSLGDENIYITADQVTLNGAVIGSAAQTFYAEPVGGVITLVLPRGSTARLYGNVRGFHTESVVVAIPDTATANLEDLIPVQYSGSLPQGLGTGSSPAFAGINDVNGNEEFKFVATPSAVNEFTITNAATGNRPSIATTGDDANIALLLSPKGSGTLDITSAGLTIGGPSNGFYSISNAFHFNPGGSAILKLDGITGNAVINQSYLFGFGSSGTSAPDVGMGRNAMGVLEINAGTNGTSGVVLLRGRTFANVPATPVTGMELTITDSSTATWGATITGGGSNVVRAWYNGTNWKVIGA